MISVVIPLYNKEQQIGYTLQSVLHQTFQQFEIVIVDDGSTDGSVAEVEKIHDDRIRLIHQKNAGVSAARNRGIAEAKYDLIAFLDADDEWKSGYLETQYGLYQKYPECSVYACNYEFHNAEGKVISTIVHKLPFKSEDGILCNYFEVASCSHPPLWTSAVVVKKEAILAIGGFPMGIKSGEDLLTWARLAVRYKIAYTTEIKAIYNLGEGYNFSNLPSRRQDENDPVGKFLLQLYKEHIPHPIGMRKYISHWHKMRASVAIRYGEKRETIIETLISLRYNPCNYKVIPLAMLAFIPKGWRMRIIGMYKQN